MRVLQVVTLVSPDGAYGGPVRVAFNQCTELSRRGHEVTLVAGTRGYTTQPPGPTGARLLTFPTNQVLPPFGFAGLHARGLVRWVRRHAATFDVVHVHVARDLISLPSAAVAQRAGVTSILQPHGMIDSSTRRSAATLDALITRRTLQSADAVLYLTEREAADLHGVAPVARLKHLPNGVPRPTSVTTRDDPQEVLFLARFQERKRPQAFLALAAELAPSFPDWQFSMVGPDEGEGHSLRARAETLPFGRLTIEGAVGPEHAIRRLSRASIYVLPSVDEPFPMSVLEALSVGVPVIVTRSCGLAPVIESRDCGVVVSPDNVQELVERTRELMIDHPRREAMGERACATARDLFSMSSIGAGLESVYLASRSGA